jgi:hypothetical protein
MNQVTIENMAGITNAHIAEYIMGGRSHAAKRAMDLLKMQTDCYDICGMELLKCSVRDCVEEMGDNR